MIADRDCSWCNLRSVMVRDYRQEALVHSFLFLLDVLLKTGPFQDAASRLFNSLPNDIKLETSAETFVRKVFKILETQAKSGLD